MQFDSFLFLVFLLVVVSLYYLLRQWRSKKILLLVASYLFYAAWSPPLVILIWISTLTDFVLARKIYRLENVSLRKVLLLLSLAVNLGMLGYFKYAQFLLDAFSDLLSRGGIIYQAPALDIILPIGISFYTFQTISYTIDVYRRRLIPDHGLLDFSLYVTFFPQLVAGPIVRASSFLPQCDKAPEFRLHEFAWGVYLLMFGLFAKVVLADFILAPVTETAFFSPANNGTLDAWLGMFAFSGQIFFDFGGYTLCALGCAMLLGFTLPDNFRSPYAAIGFSDFWRRWHISLSSWLRDYLYIALGGNRKGRVRTLGNLIVTMFLGGLWHGASWNFVLWGSLHGFFLVAEHGLSSLIKFRPDGRFFRALMILLTFLLVSLVWVPFRAVDIHSSLDFYRIMFSLNAGTSFDTANIAVVVTVIVSTLLWHAYTRQHTLEERFTTFPVWLRVVILSGMIISIGLCSTGDSRAFIYFQF